MLNKCFSVRERYSSLGGGGVTVSAARCLSHHSSRERKGKLISDKIGDVAVHQIRRATYGSDCTITVHVTMIRAPIFVCIYLLLQKRKRERERVSSNSTCPACS